MWDMIKCSNKWVIGVTQRREKREQKNIQRNNGSNFPNLMKNINL